MNSIMPTPEEVRRIEKAQRSALKRMGDLPGPTTRHPGPKEQEKLAKELAREIRKNGDVLGRPVF